MTEGIYQNYEQYSENSRRRTYCGFMCNNDVSDRSDPDRSVCFSGNSRNGDTFVFICGREEVGFLFICGNSGDYYFYLFRFVVYKFHFSGPLIRLSL